MAGTRKTRVPMVEQIGNSPGSDPNVVNLAST